MSEIKNLPKNFKYIFSQKDIRLIETETNIKFAKISNSYTSSANFRKVSEVQSNFTTLSVYGKLQEDRWEFSIVMNGFRNELLPKVLEEEIKNEIKNGITNFINKVGKSKETDLYKNPELWNIVTIKQNRSEISWKEFNR